MFDLTAKSLLVPLAQVEPHSGRTKPELQFIGFRLLETIRQYSHDRLRQIDDGQQTEQAHTNYYLALALDAEAPLYREQQSQWLAKLELEHDNLRLGV